MRGVGASPGIAIGRALVVSRSPVQVPYRPLAEDQVEREVERFRRAVERGPAASSTRPRPSWARSWPTTPTSSRLTWASWATR